MIGRDKLGEMSLEDIDKGIMERSTTLNAIGESLLPQILAEELAELRLQRARVEDRMVERMQRETGMDSADCRILLIQHNWNYDEAVTR